MENENKCGFCGINTKELQRDRDFFREKYLDELKLRKYVFKINKSFFDFQFNLNKLYNANRIIDETPEDIEKEIRLKLKQMIDSEKDFHKQFNKLEDKRRNLGLL